MSNDCLTCMNCSAMLSTTNISYTTLLSLPNETLDRIIQVLAGEPVLGPPLHTPPRDTSLHNIRLVNRRFAALGSCYILLRHRCVSEEQLKRETTDLTEEGKLRRRYTRQLEIVNVPVCYWLDAMRNLYPVVTHMSLVSVRLSGETCPGQPADTPHPVLASVKHLSIHVNKRNEAGIPILLRSFPNLVTLLLHSDSFFYTGMKNNLLLSFPPLPYLTTLYRPPLTLMDLSFSSDPGYMNTHDHLDFMFHEFCNGCLRWSQKAESNEQTAVTQLAWLFPSLREVLIPRIVLEDWMRIDGISSDASLPMFDSSARMEGLDWLEYKRRRSDVVIWIIESDNHADCMADCPEAKRQPGAPMEQALGEALSLLDPAFTISSSRPSFYAVLPRDYNEHLKYKKTESAPLEEFPKFWWTAREKRALLSCNPGVVNDVTADPQSFKESAQVKDDFHAKIFGRWDL